MSNYRSDALIRGLQDADGPGLAALLADSVTFHSPVATYEDRRDIAHLLTIIGGVVTGLEAGAEFCEGSQTVTLVAATAGEHRLDGALIQVVAADGRLAELTLLLRPLAGLVAAVQLMGERLAAAPLPSSGSPLA